MLLEEANTLVSDRVLRRRHEIRRTRQNGLGGRKEREEGVRERRTCADKRGQAGKKSGEEGRRGLPRTNAKLCLHLRGVASVKREARDGRNSWKYRGIG